MFFIPESWFGHCCKVTWKLLKESVFQLFWYAESKYKIIFVFGWIEDGQT